MLEPTSRRSFMKSAAFGAAALGAGSGANAAEKPKIKSSDVRVKARYFSRYTNPDEPQREKRSGYAETDWRIPLEKMALICLDIWNIDLHQDMRERDDRITRQRIVPLVKAARSRGLQVIHAPGPHIARRHPNRVGPVKNGRLRRETPESPNWPPRAFVGRTGEFAQYASPEDTFKFASWKLLDDNADFHQLVRPLEREPVVATGDGLHQLCAQHGILFLLFAGFHTPGCMITRTYGITAMRDRGYTCILVRDCTNGMETNETFDDQTSMRGTIAFLEQQDIYTVNSEQLIASLAKEQEACD